MTTDQPVTVATIAALSKPLREALGLAAVNQDGWASKRALKELEKRGLVEPCEELVYGQGSAPIDHIPLKIIRYEVPLLVHIAWCSWCSTQVTEDTDA